MITSSDIQNIMYRDCATFGIDRYQKGNVKKGEVTEERVIVHAKRLENEKIFNKCFVEINIFVPNTQEEEAELIRLNEVERKAWDLFDYTGEYDGTHYVVSIDSSSIEEHQSLRCHYVNARILFKVLNVKK